MGEAAQQRENLALVRIYGPWDFHNAHSALADDPTQRDFAGFYADCIRAGGSKEDWLRLNVDVQKLWPKGLGRVKKLAWKQIDLPNAGSEGP